jgi:hypothetical protein
LTAVVPLVTRLVTTPVCRTLIVLGVLLLPVLMVMLEVSAYS